MVRSSTSSDSNDGEAMFQETRINRASLSLSADLQDIANEYQASMQEMETARLELENETTYEPPPWESLPGEMNLIDSTTIDAQQDPRLREMIATAEDEVRSLRPSSSVYSNSTASIYSSLSRHSTRMSVIIDQLPTDELLQASERRRSSASSIRDSRLFSSTPIVDRGAPPKLEASQRPTQLYLGVPLPPENKLSDHKDPEKAFKDLCTYSHLPYPTSRPHHLIKGSHWC